MTSNEHEDDGGRPDFVGPPRFERLPYVNDSVPRRVKHG